MKIQDSQPSVNKWMGEVFRLTAFFPTPVDASEWWKYVIGDSPERRSEQPKVGIIQEESAYEGGHLVLTVQPGRTDWLFFPSFDERIGAPNILSELSPYETGINYLSQIVNRWFEICPSTSRIAFGMTVNVPVPNKNAGYRELSKYLNAVQIDPDNSTDFLYQINRRRTSKNIPGLSLNRLSKWLVITGGVTQVAVGALINIDNLIEDTRFFMRLELDINTAQEYKNIIPNNNLRSIYSELVELAIEITEKGDVE